MKRDKLEAERRAIEEERQRKIDEKEEQTRLVKQRAAERERQKQEKEKKVTRSKNSTVNQSVMSKQSAVSSKMSINSVFDTRDISTYNIAEFGYNTLFVQDFMMVEYESDSDGYDDKELFEEENLYGSHLYFIPKPHRSHSDFGTGDEKNNSFERSAQDSLSSYEGGNYYEENSDGEFYLEGGEKKKKSKDGKKSDRKRKKKK